MQDTLAQLRSRKTQDLKKPLKIKYVESGEEGARQMDLFARILICGCVLRQCANAVRVNADPLFLVMRSTGLDMGGVQKEFFQNIVERIFDPEVGMFEYNEDTRQFQINSLSLESQYVESRIHADMHLTLCVQLLHSQASYC